MRDTARNHSGCFLLLPYDGHFLGRPLHYLGATRSTFTVCLRQHDLSSVHLQVWEEEVGEVNLKNGFRVRLWGLGLAHKRCKGAKGI